MRKTYFLPFSQLLAWSHTDIGELAYQLGKLVASRVPINAGFVVPITTLAEIAQANHLDLKVQQWFQTSYLNHALNEAEVHQRLLDLFLNLKVPKNISENFFEVFYQIAKSKKVVWTASWSDPAVGTLDVQSEVLHGDATIFEALLEIWAHTVWTLLFNTPASHSLLSVNFLPAALVLQVEHAAQLSGFILTNLPEAAKSVYGVFLQEQPEKPAYTVDIRTWQILSRTPKSNLPETLALELAQAANRAKLHDFHHLKISWEAVANQGVVTNVERLQTVQELLPTTVPLPPFLVGHTVIRGKSTAPVKVLRLQPGARDRFDRHILVLPELLKLTVTNVKNVEGVIVDAGLSLSAQALLRAHHVPTLSHTRSATKKLKPLTTVTLDTLQGKVFLPTKASSSSATSQRIPTRRTHLMVNTSEPAPHDSLELQAVQAVVVDGNLLWRTLGTHPHHTLQSTLQQELKTKMRQVLASHQTSPRRLLYRPITLSSNNQLTLAHGQMYTRAELNPSLGYFGAIQLLHEPQTLKLELQVIQQLTSASSPISVVAPFTRNPGELAQLKNLYRRSLKPGTPIWWELAYPENVLNLANYPLEGVDGVIINLKHLFTLMIGVDANHSDLAVRYPLDPTLLHVVIQQALTTLAAAQIWLYAVPHEYQKIASLAVEYGLAGVIGQINDAATLHHQLHIAEHHWLTSRNKLH